MYCENIFNGIYPSGELVMSDRLHAIPTAVPLVQYVEFQICGCTYPSDDLSSKFEICYVSYVRFYILSIFIRYYLNVPVAEF